MERRLMASKRTGRAGKRRFAGLFLLLLAGTTYAGVTWLQHPGGTSYASGTAPQAAIKAGAYPVDVGDGGGTPDPSPTCPPAGWIAAAPIPTAVARYAFAQDGEDLYVVAGDSAAGGETGSARRYNASTNNWTDLAPIPRPVDLAGAAVYGGKLYVVGGYNSPSYPRYLQVYDIQANSWAIAPLPLEAVGSAVGAYNGTLFVVGGASARAQLATYDIASGVWVITSGAFPADYQTGGYAQAGRYLYAVGGFGPFFARDPSKVLSPKSGKGAIESPNVSVSKSAWPAFLSVVTAHQLAERDSKVVH